METVNWQKCQKGVIGTYPPKNGKMRGLHDPVTPGMKVIAKYNNLDVHLEINNEVANDAFIATVLFFEPINAEKPDDLKQGDKVTINREHICWILDV